MATRKSTRWSSVSFAMHGGRVVAVATPSPAEGGKPPKYRNRKVTVAGVTFDSAGEQRRYVELCQLLARGEISDLKHGAAFELAPACHLGGARKKPALRYRADFTYRENGALVVEDFKSPATRTDPVYRIKKHLMMTVHSILIRESSRG